MREIKFRAWDGQKMTDVICIAGNGHKTTWEDDGERIDVRLKSVDWPVMQYTGLKDKNGKEIYEGDVVKQVFSSYGDNDFDIIRQAKFSHIVFRGHGFWVEKEDFGWEGESLWNWATIEVIGNIYENPEFMT